MQGRPTLEQYGYDQNAYDDARDAWVVAQAKQSWQAEQAQANAARQAQEKISAFQSRLAAFERKSPGAWGEAVSAPLDATQVMLEAIQGSEVGPEVAVYLAKNLDEAHNISRLPPFQQAVAMGRIEAKLLQAPAPPARPVTVTRAPAPPPSIASGSPASTPVSKWGIEDHLAEVKRQKQAKYG